MEVVGRGVIDVRMVPDIQSLEEVVVIGYGTREKKDITTSISTLNSKDISKSNPPANIHDGKMAGVFVSVQGDPDQGLQSG